MRLLHVVPSYIPAWRYGGPIYSVHGLCAALARRGHEVIVATTNVDGSGESNVPLKAAVLLDGVVVRYFPSRFLRQLYFSPPMYGYLSREIPKCDVVHTHSVFLWPTSAAAYLARRSCVPHVLSPRGMLVGDLIERKSPTLKRAWISLFERRNIQRASAIHVTSTLEADEIRKLGLHPQRVFEAPNGIDVVATPERSRTFDDLPERYVLFLGRINWKKGLDRLVAAMVHVGGVPLVIAGNDEDGYLSQVREMTRAAGIEDRVVYTGHVEGDGKARLLAGASVLALPSYSENFGNVVLEAMSYGTPVVVTPEVGIASFVKETNSGMVAPGDPASLSQALIDILSDPLLALRLGANGKQSALSHFSWDGIAQRMEMLYLSLV